MYSILNESLGWSETSLPTEKQVLITDSLSAEGAFLLPHFINYFVKSKQRVILVGLEQGFGHYSTICKKLGVTLQQAHSSGQFVYINGVAAPYDWTHEVTIEPTNSAAAAIHGIANANPFSLASSTATANAKDILEPLYRMIVRHMPVEEIRSTCIIFDNLSALSAVVGEEALISFVQSCRALTETHAEKHNGSASCVVALVHADVDDLLVSSLSHSSDLVLKVDGFKTGFSNEEDGQLSFYTSDPFKYRDHKLPVLIYKLSESKVDFRVIRK